MKIVVSNLIGPRLDYAVALARKQPNQWLHDFRLGYPVSSSTDWAQGGPIIEREKISFKEEQRDLYVGFVFNGVCHVQLSTGPTPLIAAMRCYVASKLGDEVDIPDELT
jgi:hypothetical protein